MNGSYIYQTVHTLDGVPYRLTAHRECLDAASRALYRRPFARGATELRQQITALLATNPPPVGQSVFVRICATGGGDIEVAEAGVSLYRGYALRSLTPEAITLHYDIPLGDYPTSAREAAAALATDQARARGMRSVVRSNSDGVILTGDDAPLFAVKGATVYTSPTLMSVEASVAAEAIAAAGLTLIIQPILHTELTQFDELFYFDHRGVTALARCDSHPYMSLIAERIAHAASKLKP